MLVDHAVGRAAGLARREGGDHPVDVRAAERQARLREELAGGLAVAVPRLAMDTMSLMIIHTKYTKRPV